tara:strand:- start:1213 stop:3237 length:2025 start_codon:yes stop_codon:yes gene_type:complete
MRTPAYICILSTLLALTDISEATAQEQYTLQGDATATGSNCYQLTDALPNEIGAVWYDETINLEQPFQLQFKMNFGTNDGAGGSSNPGADGMMFVMQTDGPTALGLPGEGLGFAGFSPSLGIEFDTYWNQNMGDIIADHIGIMTNGSVNHNLGTSLAGPVTATSESTDIENGEDYAVEIVWDPAEQNIEVYFDCEFRISTNVDLINDIFEGSTIVTWGFTAATGGANNVHTVCLYENATPTGDVMLCLGDTTQLIAPGDLSQSFSWDPADFLSDPNIYNPTASPISTQVYTVTYTDFCGDIQTSSVEVFVEPLEVDITANYDTLDCINTSSTLLASSNFPSGVIFSWEVAGEGNIVSSIDWGAVVNEAGTYQVNASFDDGACTTEDTYTIEIDTIPFNADAGPDGVINCYEPYLVLLGGSDGENAEYVWTTSENGGIFGSSNIPQPTAISGGVYELTVTNPLNGCISSDDMLLVADFTEPEILLGQPDGMINCDNLSVNILGTEIYPDGYTSIIEWSFSEGEGALLDPTDDQPTALLPGDYLLTVTFLETGCSTVANSVVTVEEDESSFIDISSLTVPNVLTPGTSNGFNDYLTPFLKDLPEVSALSILDVYNLKVFNRWGILVFQNNGLPLAWDGRANGSLLSPGSYMIMIDYMYLCDEVQTGSHIGPLEIIY